MPVNDQIREVIKGRIRNWVGEKNRFETKSATSHPGAGLEEEVAEKLVMR